MNDREESADNIVEGEEQRRPRKVRRILAGAGLAAMVGAGVLWTQRIPIADHFIASELAALNVPATYTVTRIGPHIQRIENLALGDPARPDLTAQWVEVDIGYAGLSPTVKAVRASGVRLRGSLRDDTLSLGVLDRFLEGQGGSGQAGLPDIDLTVIDARGTVTSDYGPLGLVLNGAGNMFGGFNGRMALAAPRVDVSGCRIQDVAGALSVVTSGGHLAFKGPLRAPGVSCTDGATAVSAPELNLDLRLAKAFAGVSGAVTLASPGLSGRDLVVTRASGLLTFDGPFNALTGTHALTVESFRTALASAGAAKLGGRFAMRAAARGGASSVNGTLVVNDLAPADRRVMDRAVASTAALPLGPLARRLAEAVWQAGRANRVNINGELQLSELGAEIAFKRGRLVAESGARIDITDSAKLVIDRARGRWQGTGGLRMGGGGLPEASLTVRKEQSGSLAGAFEMEPYAAEGARLAMTPAAFAMRPDGSGHVRTALTLDGPLPDGAVRGLSLPVDLAIEKGGGVRLAGDCALVSWQSLRLTSARLDPATLRLCAQKGEPLLAWNMRGLTGGFALAPFALTGAMGANPLSLQASSARFSLKDFGFSLTDLAMRMGDASAPVILEAAHLDGVQRGERLTGQLAGGHARIGAVPIDMTGIAGQWSYAGGRLALGGGMTVSDTAPDQRFFPMDVSDARLALVGGRIGAEGTIRHKRRDRSVAKVRIAHDLANGSGSALFDLENLVFGSSLQPDDLTPLSLGVVANVEANVSGSGQIDWTSAGVTSTGRFSTSGARFAAAFGPVEGFGTVIQFDDLLGLRTARGQVATIASVNPGIEARDGMIRYAINSSEEAQIEGGHWPFAGGDLDLLPATLALDSRKPRHLAFRVTGLDAGSFINTLELKDISATGTYDGLLPMIFDETGGRIEGGVLVARQAGLPPLVVENAATLTVPCDPNRVAGSLSYVGQLSNEQLGAFGTLAFEALKNLRYKCLTILMDGALDGEFVTRIAINGVNQGTPAAAQSMLARPFLGLPFVFNVRIEAPFRGLLNTAQSFIDPSNLIRESLGPQYQTVLDAGAGENSGLAVQPSESDKGVTKDQR